MLCLLLLGGLIATEQGSSLLLWGVQGVARSGHSVALLAMLFVAPGLAVLQLLWPRGWLLSPAGYVGLALGLSTALPPLLLLGFNLIGVSWYAITTWAYVLLSLSIVAWSIVSSRRQRAQVFQDEQQRIVGHVWGVLLVVVIMALLVRLYAVRELPTGLFGDSYHHTIITQLLIDNQGLFHSWEPYAPLASFTYHFGFHANAAFVHHTLGIGAVQSVIWTGQIYNVLSVVLAFVLADALRSNRDATGGWAGVWAVLMVGFVLTLPGFLVNWGRYTSLAGQVVLVPVVVCWIGLGERIAQQIGEQQISMHSLRALWHRYLTIIARNWRLLLLAALATGALMLTHYRVTVFAALFVGSYLIVLVLARRSAALAGVLFLQAAMAASIALLLVSPWLLNLAQGYLLRNAVAMVSGGVEASRVEQIAALPAIHPFYLHRLVIGAAALGLLIAGWQRQWRIALCALWSGLLVLCVVPRVVGLPGTGLIDHLTALGALYVSVAPLAGYALAQVQATMGQWLASAAVPGVVYPTVSSVLVAGVLLWGGTDQAQMMREDTQLVTHADMAAMQWVAEHTSSDARFLVNSFPAYGGTMVAGTDAGWWLAFLTGRPTNVPPITYGSETAAEPGYMEQVNRLTATLRDRPLTDATAVSVNLTTPEALQALREARIDYVYSGAHAAPDASQADRINTALLRQSPIFQLVYHQDGVEIFRVVDDAAGPDMNSAADPDESE